VIGVLAKVDQLPVVEEFFELFKTPWEPYRYDRRYDVVVVTSDDVPDIDANLILIYGAGEKTSDVRHDIRAVGRQSCVVSDRDGTALPIYCGLATFEPHQGAHWCVSSAAGAAALRLSSPSATIIRVGYDVFDEVQFVLSHGQPIAQAHIPTIDLHIRMLRNWILEVGNPLLEVAPMPPGHDFVACLTHDIDFIGIRGHFLDHTMLGFLYRSTAGTVLNVIRGRLTIGQVLRIWRAVAVLPFVYLGWAKDFWEPFEWYGEVERDLPATYYLIPFKRRAGEKVPGTGAARRATAYDIADLQTTAAALTARGCEIGVHGLDAWHDAAKGCLERERVAEHSGQPSRGIRMHWLLNDERTPAVLEQAGYAYDATAGYNDTIGYRHGTTQVFRPMGAQRLLELPLHIQDGALFYPQKLNLSEPEAEQRCRPLLAHARQAGGVLTTLWHDRSHGPERFWGAFYARLVGSLKESNPWFSTAGQAVQWFQHRRDVQFERTDNGGGSRLRLRRAADAVQPPLRVIVHRGAAFGETITDIPWTGEHDLELEWRFGQPLTAGSLL
jgi:hypothetical protein